MIGCCRGSFRVCVSHSQTPRMTAVSCHHVISCPPPLAHPHRTLCPYFGLQTWTGLATLTSPALELLTEAARCVGRAADHAEDRELLAAAVALRAGPRIPAPGP